MQNKTEKVARLIAGLRSDTYDPRYLGYFECFNRQLFYEAHEVLEELWLAARGTPEARYYQGLIMAAGAFVHFQKNRPKGAANLLQKAIERLKPYGTVRKGFDVDQFIECLESWLYLVESAGCGENPYHPKLAPRLKLRDE